MTMPPTRKFVTTLTPGDRLRYGGRLVEVVAPLQPGSRFQWMVHAIVRDCETHEELTLTFTTAERVFVEVRS